MSNSLTVAMIDSILTLHKRRWSQRRIARELGIDRETVRRYLRQVEAAPKPANAPIGSETTDDAPKPANAPIGSAEAGVASRPADILTPAGGCKGDIAIGHRRLGNLGKTTLIRDMLPSPHIRRRAIAVSVLCHLAATRAEGRSIVAVGTTSARVLETAARSGTFHPFQGETALYLRPGHEFRGVDAFVTNFHLPCNSLLLLVSALAGVDLIRAAYAEAIRERYRFYSYGDAMLIR